MFDFNLVLSSFIPCNCFQEYLKDVRGEENWIAYLQVIKKVELYRSYL
jgi:hypothetical protein